MNYNGSGAAGASGIGSLVALAETGPSHWLWIFLAGFALIAAGSALLRMIPKRESM